MRRTVWTCDGLPNNAPCPETETTPSANVPATWFELSAYGAYLGHFCPSCAKCVNVPESLARLQDRTAPPADGEKRMAQ
jgi:hypothetical protein